MLYYDIIDVNKTNASKDFNQMSSIDVTIY